MDIREFKIERFYAEHEFSVPHMLSGSDAESMTIAQLLAIDGNYHENLDKLLSTRLSYTESQGDPTLIEKITEMYNGIEPEHVLTYNGAEEGIFGFMAGVLKRGNHLVCQFPSYQSLHEVARANGVRVTRWEMREDDDNWTLDLGELDELIDHRTTAVMVNSPHNPTGHHLTKDEQTQLIEICRENDAILFSDEVYRLGEYRAEDRLPAAAELYDNAVSLGVLSKPLGLPGLRIGWVVTKNTEIMRKLKVFKDYTTICNSAPSEKLAIVAIENREKILRRNLSLIKKNLNLLREFMRRHNELFAWREPRAGTIAFVRCKFTDDVEQFCTDLLERKGVLLLPGTKYEYGNLHFRIGFGRADFAQGLSKLNEYVEENLQ